MRAPRHLLLRSIALFDRPPLRFPLAFAISSTSRVACLDRALHLQLQTILRLHPVHFAAATLLWLLCVRWRLPVPPYSVHRLITSTTARAAAQSLCERYLAKRYDQRVARQRLLLDAAKLDNPAVIAQAHKELDRIVSAALPATGKRNVRFERAAAAVALQDIASICSGLGLRMFLVSGTLLGAIRDGRFVRSDYDVDVGFFAAEAPTTVIADAIAASRRFIHVNRNEYFISAVHTNGTVVDVFAHFDDGGRLWHGSAQHRWYNSNFELEALDFENGRYLVPVDADRYLTENYGDWRAPSIFWDTSFDTPNRTFTPGLESLFMLLDYAAMRNNRFRAQQALIALRDDFGIDYTHHLPYGSWQRACPTRARPSTIVYGHFDPPDADELQRIERAADFGGRVIVAVAADELLLRHCGRPALSDAGYRAAFARGLRHVDDVFIDDGGETRKRWIEKEADMRLLLPPGLELEFAEFSHLIVPGGYRPAS